MCDYRFHNKPLEIRENNLRIPCNWSRVSLAPDAVYVAVGSTNCNVLIWNIEKNTTESWLQGGHNFPVTSCSWSPTGRGLATCDTRKHLAVWK
ncbi:hypothetical protein HZS_3881 [Henneguya salminicola]|nr:hypothetical protein HZS_3881 [Henneguya salminicola]